jgi:hypothetical protein
MTDDLDPVTLGSFLQPLNVSAPEPLPMVHTTESSLIFRVLKPSLQSNKIAPAGLDFCFKWSVAVTA